MADDAFRAALLRWYAQQRRPLAWRTTRDPYRILVSEVMLQQTQAARVEPAWRAFVQRFPTVRTLAAAPVADVVTAWRGLGYNRRAVNLQRAARVLVDEHAGRVPADLDALRALPGVGEYTARAVLVFAFDRPAAPVDTNVARVLRRAVAGRALAPRAVQRLADGLVPESAPHAWTSALMDLGAEVCTARRPACGGCPVGPHCAWRGAAETDPAVRPGRRRAPDFAGSDRFHRGRLVDALRAAAVPAAGLAAAAGLEDRTRARTLAQGLVADGLAEWRDGYLALPEA